MLIILDNLYKYVPNKLFVKDVSVGEAKYSISINIPHTILLGGDQLTAARCRGCKDIRNNSDNECARLTGFQPVAEDWHTKVVLLEVSCVKWYGHAL